MTEEITKAIVLVIPTITGVVVGFLLAGGQRWFERRRKLRSHWAAIRAEMALCKETAETFLNASIMSPLYRFPFTAFQTAFPILLAEGHLNEQEVLALSRYSAWVQDLNRGLDNAAECALREDRGTLEREYQRNLLKAKTLIGTGSEVGIMETAKNIVNTKLNG